ncbi:MAG TPA: DUF3147 family protein [Candidatus Sulfotelmatobacter sp.]|nr:DUF3147 family protein [Candidatus Sulfotelmatobacter sp.]
MPIEVHPSALKRTKWHEYLVRFVFGGLITAAAGIIAKKFGPEVGGLFLAFPAIFPATATLVEKHETEKKREKGQNDIVRGRDAAAFDAAGSAMGSVGLFVFAVLVLQFIQGHSLWLVLAGATLCWLAASVLTWWIRMRVL